MFGSLIDLATSVVRVVAVPVDLALNVANAVVKPVAEVAEDLADDVKSIFK